MSSSAEPSPVDCVEIDAVCPESPDYKNGDRPYGASHLVPVYRKRTGAYGLVRPIRHFRVEAELFCGRVAAEDTQHVGKFGQMTEGVLHGGSSTCPMKSR